MDERDGTRRIVEAVEGLEQAVGRMALILKDHSTMLSQLLLMAVEPIRETELEKLMRQLVARINHQQGTLERIEKEMGAFNATLAKVGAAP